MCFQRVISEEEERVQKSLSEGGSKFRSRKVHNTDNRVPIVPVVNQDEHIQEFHDYIIKYGIGLILLYVLFMYRYIWMYKKVWIALPYLGYIWYSRLKSIKCVQQCLNGTAQTHVQLYHRILMTQLSNILTNMDGQ